MWYAHRLFSVGGCDYDGLDVAVAATAWGDWGRVRDHARHAIACSRHAEATEDDADPGEVESAAADFRYARDLITAEDTGAWLGQWGLSVEAWMDAMERSVLRRRWAAELEELAGRYPVSDEELSAVLAAEAICSGDLARLAETLAARAVIHDGHPVAASVGRADESRGAPEPDPVAIPYPTAGLSAVSPERWRERAAHVAALEASFEQFRRAAVTPAAVRAYIDAHRLDWIVVDCRYLAFAEADAAREAALCIREDGHALADVARDARIVVHEARVRLDALSPSLRSHFVAAGTGALLGPLPFEDEMRLCLVADKRLPSESDPEIRRRAEDGVLARLVEQDVASRVRWHVRW